MIDTWWISFLCMPLVNLNFFEDIPWCQDWLITMVEASNILYLILFSSFFEIPSNTRLLLAGKSLILFKKDIFE